MPLVNRAFALLSRWTGLQIPLRRNPCIIDRVPPFPGNFPTFIRRCGGFAFASRRRLKRQHAPLKVGDPLFDHRFVHPLILI